MGIEIVAGLLASPLSRMLAFEIAVTLACQVVQAAAGTMARQVIRVGDAPAPVRKQPPAGEEPATDGQTITPSDAATDAGAGPATAATDAGAGPDTAMPPQPSALRPVPAVDVVSEVTGRVRLRVQGLRNNTARAREVEATLRWVDGVTKATANPLTGTVLVQGAPGRFTSTELLAALASPPAAHLMRNPARAPYLRLVVG